MDPMQYSTIKYIFLNLTCSSITKVQDYSSIFERKVEGCWCNLLQLATQYLTVQYNASQYHTRRNHNNVLYFQDIIRTE